MTLKTKVLASFAAGALLVSQSAAAAVPARTSAGTTSADQFAGTPPGAWVAIGPILALLVLFGIMALTDDDNDFPESP